MATLLGFITLIGIATRDGIMLVSHNHHLMDMEGVTDHKEAARRAPILIAAMTECLALLPILVRHHAPPSEIQAPTVAVFFFGLLCSTALNMLGVPSLYLRFGARARWREGNGALQERFQSWFFFPRTPGFNGECRRTTRRFRFRRWRT